MSKNKYNDINNGQNFAIYTKLGGPEGVKRFLAGELIMRKPSPNRRLKSVDAVECPRIERFEAKDNFGKGVVNGVKFYDFNENFKKLFIPKVETDVAETILQSHQLLRNSNDLGILKEIEDGKEITNLAHLHYALTLQGDGRGGVLLVNGYANIFYIRGTDGNLWAVFADWCDDGWSLNAHSVEYPDVWNAGSQVFSR